MCRNILAWRKRDASKPPPLLKYRSSSWFILSVVCIAVFTDIFLYGVIIPVIPFALEARVGIAPNNVQHWTSILLAVYGAAVIASSPICGHFADHTTSRRLPLLIGLLTLFASTLLLCLGNSLPLLIVGRALQGISAAIVWTVGLALLVDTVGYEKTGEAMGYVALSMSVSVLIGPLLGGVVYARAGYYAVFAMAFGLIALDILLQILLVEKKIAKKWDPERSETASPIPPSSLSDEKPLEAATPPPKDATLSHPAPSNSPLPELTTKHQKLKHPFTLLLTSRRLLSALYTTLTYSILLTSWDAVLPLRTSHLFSFTSLGAGLMFLPLIIPTFLAPPIGAWSDRHGPRLPVTCGFILATPVLVCIRFVDHSGIRQVVLLCALLALLGLALAMGMTPLLAEIAYVVSHKEKTHPGGVWGKARMRLRMGF
ncbi:hypothetical protein N7G274_005248 [Stereocaulon virgatum]|uniref:Major facilitator superfamily (MFS) profile domain-containing protein n=1 Tax=Stereocaulon virgatum TaxID=373712 RepID=A0ABR4AAD1_9LECA